MYYSNNNSITFEITFDRQDEHITDITLIRVLNDDGWRQTSKRSKIIIFHSEKPMFYVFICCKLHAFSKIHFFC